MDGSIFDGRFGGGGLAQIPWILRAVAHPPHRDRCEYRVGFHAPIGLPPLPARLTGQSISTEKLSDPEQLWGIT